MSEIRKPETPPGGEAGRVRCLYCGANNFPGSAACWQCGRPFQAARAGSDPGQPTVAPPTPSSPSPARANPFAVHALPQESALAPKAAAALGLLFPYVGLPVGIVFLMLDDPRKTQLGWITIGWSLAGTVLNGLALAATLGPVWALLKGMLPHGGLPPTLPPMPGGDGLGGDGAGLLLPFRV